VVRLVQTPYHLFQLRRQHLPLPSAYTGPRATATTACRRIRTSTCTLLASLPTCQADLIDSMARLLPCLQALPYLYHIPGIRCAARAASSISVAVTTATSRDLPAAREAVDTSLGRRDSSTVSASLKTAWRRAMVGDHRAADLPPALLAATTENRPSLTRKQIARARNAARRRACAMSGSV